jgi:PAS domain S-box-containing protein
MAEQAPATILVVDDDAANRRACGQFFRDAGFRVLEAGTGEEALRLTGQKPDLVVLDINLPDIDGFEVCRRLRARPETRPVPVLQLSAVYVGSGDRVHGLEEGADGYLVKPVEPRELLATVRSLLRTHAAEEAARAAAQEWRTTFDSIGDSVCLLDPAGGVRRCNRAFTELLGKPFPDVLGRPLARLLQESLHDVPPLPAELLDPGQPPQTRELALGARWVRAKSDPIPGDRGQPAGRVLILTDITERKALEEQLRQVQMMEAVGRLAGGVAHDFNNLLAAILGNTALLLRSLAPEGPDHERVSIIERAAWRAADLTRQLLNFSRQAPLWPQPTDLNDILAEVAESLRKLADPRVAVEARPAPGLWVVHADRRQMARALLGLGENALDAMPEGGRLTLQTSNCEVTPEHAREHVEARPGTWVCVSVRDTGSGIPPDLLPRIFDPFFTTKPPHKGAGLGLAMVHGIVKQHRGWIECHSQPGKGTRFDIYLPRAAPSAAPPG